MIAAEALLSASRIDEAEHRLTQVESRLDPRTTPGAWGEFLRLRGDLRARQTRTTEAYHDIAQSSSVFELVGERYQAAVSQLALARLAARAGAKSTADRHYQHAAQVFQSLGATRDLEQVRIAMAAAQPPGTGEYVGSPADADDALVKRLVDAAVLPDLLARELAAALLEAVTADVAVVFVELPGGDVRVIAHAGADAEGARTVARLAVQGAAYGAGSLIIEPIGREPDGPRAVALATTRPLGHPLLRRVRMMAAVARQGFDLCGVRDRPDGGGGRQRGAPARAAAARLPLRQRGDAPRRRSDPATAGQRPHGADHRRERHGQGTRRARDSRRVAAQRRDVPALQLHDHHARTRGQPTLRASTRIVHRRGVRPARPGPHGHRRHAVPRRSRRPARSTCSPSCSASWSRARSCRWARRGRSPWTCA